jgi:hypothetical protein
MKSVAQKNIKTILILFLMITLMAASSMTHGRIQADAVMPTDATAVSPILDEARAVKQVISAQGGEITATAADGSRFTLVFPPNALLSDVEITMTPVAQVGQLPLSGGLVAAVQLEPEGLLLWEPASLTIEPAVQVDVLEQLSFTWREQGEGFHLYPLQIDPSSITMKLVHFSGYGLGRGTDAEADAAAAPDEQDRLEWATEKLTRKERKFRSQNPVFLMEQLQSGMQEAAAGKKNKDKNKKRDRKLCADFNQERIRDFDVLKSQFDAALKSKDEANLRCKLNEALKWERFVTIEQAFTGCLPAELATAYEILADFRLEALKILADKAFERCGSNVAEALRLIGLEREARRYQALYAGDGVNDVLFGLLAGRIREKAKECARFELQFESIIEGKEFFESRVRATVPIQYDPEKTTLAESPLEYLSFSVKDSCLRAGNVQGSTFFVIDLEFDLNLRDDQDCSGANKPEAELVSMTISPQPPSETVIDTGCDGESESIQTNLWAAGFLNLHQKEFDNARSGFVIRNWSKGSNQLLARKTYPPSNGNYSERTTLDLFYRPE